jgi:hypothetical protein
MGWGAWLCTWRHEALRMKLCMVLNFVTVNMLLAVDVQMMLSLQRGSQRYIVLPAWTGKQRGLSMNQAASKLNFHTSAPTC